MTPEEVPPSLLDQLPPMYTGELSLEQLQALFRDYDSAEVLDVGYKTAQAGFSQRGGKEISAALAGLLSGAALGVQIRYRYSAEEWWDTLLLQPDGRYRLVRIRAPGEPHPER